MTDKRWAQRPFDREQQVLFAETLDEVVAANDPIRAFERCLDVVDWGPWEARYASWRGQPPIHPRLMAGAILYGLMRGIRSSRDLEDATLHRLDFIWFLERRSIDHSTFADFRTRFGAELKKLHRDVSRAVCTHYKESLLALILDGTRARANSDRHGARTAPCLERLIEDCAQELNRRLDHLADKDDRDEDEVAKLRIDVERLQAQGAHYEKVLEVARERDARKHAVEGANARAVRVPVTDPDAQIVPNKEGGFAPNYTPTVAVDPATRLVVAGEVLEGSEEPAAVLPAVQAAQALSGATPEQVVADTGFASGPVLESLETQNIDAYMPTTTDFRDSNPARRPDPSTPVPQADWDRLPMHGRKLAGAAFVYDAAHDHYWCPLGRILRRVRRVNQPRTGVPAVQYHCPGKAGCPLAEQCVRKKAAARTITRDCYQDVRDRVGRRMATPEGRETYRRRAPVVEGVFAEIKHVMGVRRFLLRGLDKVRIEWDWICAAFNLKRLLRLMTPETPPATRKRRAATTIAPVVQLELP